MTRTEWGKIDREPVCDRCGQKATHYFNRTSFIKNIRNNFCDSCLKLVRAFYHV